MPTAAMDTLGVRKLTLRDRFETAQLWVTRLVTIRLRRAYYVERPAWVKMLRLLPARLVKLVGLNDESAVGSRKIELGVGPFPQPGYIHLDSDWRGHHLEAVAMAQSLPFADGFADEIVAVHLFEHIHPSQVGEVLAEWKRVLRPGGVLQLHVPDAEALIARFLSASPGEKWKFVSAMLGMYSASDAAGPDDIATRADHQLMLDWPFLQSILRDAGFERVENVSDRVRDRHSDGWEAVMPQISLVARAHTPF